MQGWKLARARLAFASARPVRVAGREFGLYGAPLKRQHAFSLPHLYLRDILLSVLDRFVAAPFNPPPIAAILEIPQQDRATAASASFVEGFSKTADYVAEAIVEGGVTGVDDTIDRLLDDGRYEELYQQLITAVPWWVAARVYQSPADATQLEVPVLVLDRVTLALRLEYEVFRAQWRVNALSGLEGGEPARPLNTETLFGASLPHQMRAAAIAYRIGEVCGIALSSGKFASLNELAVLLVEKWIHGARANLGVWVGILRLVDPRAPEVDAQILPTRYVTDLQRIHDEHLEAQRGLAIALDEVDRTGSGFPVQES